MAAGNKGRWDPELAVVGGPHADGVGVHAAILVGYVHRYPLVASTRLNRVGRLEPLGHIVPLAILVVVGEPLPVHEVGAPGIEGKGLGAEERGIAAQVDVGQRMESGLGGLERAELQRLVVGVKQLLNQAYGVGALLGHQQRFAGGAILPQVIEEGCPGIDHQLVVLALKEWPKGLVGREQRPHVDGR